jgi:hypothetical protein
MSGKFVSLVLVDREAQNIDDEWGRGFKGITHLEFETVQDARQFFLEQDTVYSHRTPAGKGTRFVLIPYMGKK